MPPESFELIFARSAAQAARAGIVFAVFLALTPCECASIIREASEERRAWDKLHDHRTANQMALLANCHRKKGAPAFSPADFLPQEESTEADNEAAFYQFAAVMGAKN